MEQADQALDIDGPEVSWQAWGARFREAAKEKGKTFPQIGRAMKPARADSTIRSWTNGTRKINLIEFFELCRAADVDPAVVLFGSPLMTAELRRSLSDTARKVIEADPAASPTYGQFGDKLRQKVRARKAAEARAVSRLKTS